MEILRETKEQKQQRQAAQGPYTTNNGMYTPDKIKESHYERLNMQVDGIDRVKFFFVRDFGPGGIKREVIGQMKATPKGGLSWTAKGRPSKEIIDELIKANLIKKGDVA